MLPSSTLGPHDVDLDVLHVEHDVVLSIADGQHKHIDKARLDRSLFRDELHTVRAALESKHRDMWPCDGDGELANATRVTSRECAPSRDCVPFQLASAPQPA